MPGLFLSKGRPVIINKLPVPVEMPPGPVSAPPPFPWGLSGQLPAGEAPLLFNYCKCCSLPFSPLQTLHVLIIFSSGICSGIKTKKKMKKNILLFFFFYKLGLLLCVCCFFFLFFFKYLPLIVPGVLCYSFCRALNKQVLLIFNSYTFRGGGLAKALR